MEDTVDQNASCRKLLASVVALAVKDACLPPIKVRSKENKMLRKVPSEAACSALHFLMGKSVLGYLEMLDMDSDRWRKELMSQMNTSNTEANPFNSQITAFEKRCFGWNYWWVKANPDQRKALSDEDLDEEEPLVEREAVSV
jgi:hypothetical protein